METLREKLSKCKEDNVVAFKTKNDEWYTGVVKYLRKLKEEDYNYRIIIVVNIPVEPQWYSDDDKTLYDENDIKDLIILE